MSAGILQLKTNSTGKAPDSPRLRVLPPPPPVDLAALRVLVLEHDPVQRGMLRAALTACGVGSVTDAADGASGLALLVEREHQFDIVVSDLKMAGVDGIDFMRRAVRRSIRGFILSSALEHDLLASAASVVRGYGIPLLGVLAKPVATEHLRDMLRCFQASKEGDAARARAPLRRVWSKRDLVGAMDLQQFVPFFQPKFDLASKRPGGMEILARWHHPQLGILAPAQFIERMEDEGLIERLTESIFRQALACAREWQDGGRPLALALNISALSFRSLGMPERMLSIVNEYGIAPDQVTMEMSESAVVANLDDVPETVARLRRNGFKIALDGFGTDNGSLQQLGAIAFTEIKIGRSLMSAASAPGPSRAVLDAVLRMAAALGLHTVAEGIESEDQRDCLKSLGCASGQGYLFALPMSQQALRRWRAAL